MTEEQLKKMVAGGNDDAYAVRGGKILTPKIIEQLESNAFVQVVDRVMGGGKKKKMNVEESDHSATDKSSTETDAVFEAFDRCSRTGTGGRSAEMTEAMLEMDDEMAEGNVKEVKKQLLGRGD